MLSKLQALVENIQLNIGKDEGLSDSRKMTKREWETKGLLLLFLEVPLRVLEGHMRQVGELRLIHVVVEKKKIV